MQLDIGPETRGFPLPGHHFGSFTKQFLSQNDLTNYTEVFHDAE